MLPGSTSQEDILNLAQADASLYESSLRTFPNLSKDIALAIKVKCEGCSRRVCRWCSYKLEIERLASCACGRHAELVSIRVSVPLFSLNRWHL